MKKPTPTATSNSSADKANKDKPAAEYRRPACYNDRDNWGKCCSTCPYWGEAYKPCSCCEEYYE